VGGGGGGVKLRAGSIDLPSVDLMLEDGRHVIVEEDGTVAVSIPTDGTALQYSVKLVDADYLLQHCVAEAPEYGVFYLRAIHRH
jgi:hypothetical protein